MDNTLYEINKHKFNIVSLSNKLFSAININEEIFINNELKKEVEFLSSLLNIKNNAMMNQMIMNNNMNIFNPMMNQNFAFNNNQLQQLMQQQLLQMQQMMQQQQMQQEMFMNQQMEDKHKEEEAPENIVVIFHSNKGAPTTPPIQVQCNIKEKMSKVIERYRKKASDFSKTIKFIYNSKAINPCITVAEAGIGNNANIFVAETNGVRGG